MRRWSDGGERRRRRRRRKRGKRRRRGKRIRWGGHGWGREEGVTHVLLLVVEDNGAVLEFHGVVGTEVLDQEEVGVSLLMPGLVGGRLLVGGGRLWLDLRPHVDIVVEEGVVKTY